LVKPCFCLWLSIGLMFRNRFWWNINVLIILTRETCYSITYAHKPYVILVYMIYWFWSYNNWVEWYLFIFDNWCLKLRNRIWWSINFGTVSSEVKALKPYLVKFNEFDYRIERRIRALDLVWSCYCKSIHNDASVVSLWLGFVKRIKCWCKIRW
jgi:hypothetical protein